VSAYRDRPVTCARCGVELVREGTREIWTCKRCSGSLVGVGELVTELLAVAPHLLPEGGVQTISTIGRRSTQPLIRCPACRSEMEPVFLGGVELERCYHDELLWFEQGETQAVLDRALQLEHDPERI
jgi:Zn-finger nucleic acid-binding protein